jgi:hypothetical protein
MPHRRIMETILIFPILETSFEEKNHTKIPYFLSIIIIRLAMAEIQSEI